MSRDSDLTPQELRGAMKNMFYLLTEDWTVFYRRGEKPTKDGRCPECDDEMEGIPDKRQRCKHIHDCRKRTEAKSRGVSIRPRMLLPLFGMVCKWRRVEPLLRIASEANIETVRDHLLPEHTHYARVLSLLQTVRPYIVRKDAMLGSRC